jgi:hypothetical protein
LQKAEAFADAGDWQKADSAYSEVLKRWNKNNQYLTAILRHNEVHDLDQIITRTGEYVKLADYNEYKASNTVLKMMLKDLVEGDYPKLGNIF